MLLKLLLLAVAFLFLRSTKYKIKNNLGVEKSGILARLVQSI
jgi:hypothetical protein